MTLREVHALAIQDVPDLVRLSELIDDGLEHLQREQLLNPGARQEELEHCRALVDSAIAILKARGVNVRSAR